MDLDLGRFLEKDWVPQEVGGLRNEGPAGGSRRVRNLFGLIREICKLGEKSSSATGKPQCPRVPKSLVRSDANGSDDHNYQPKVISFGPYHYGNPMLVRGEKIKIKLAAHFFREVAEREEDAEVVVRDLFGQIHGTVEDLRACYDTEMSVNVDDDEFCVMMLVDGCALLCYILYVCIGGKLDDYDIRYEDLSHLHRDALLLENQLPYELLLEGLMRRMQDRSTDVWRLNFQYFFGLIDKPFIQESSVIEENALVQIFNPDVEAQTNRGEELGTIPCHHLLHLYRIILLGDDELSRPTDWEDDIGGPGSVGVVKEQVSISFRNVKELMAAGIRIKPSPTRNLRDISFTSNGITACLRVPTITIDNSTKAMFLNLIALEMSSDVPRDFISYLRFLDSLIDHADDVEELHAAGVLRNNLDTHEVVAEFFNTVSANLDSNSYGYEDVRMKIRKHLVSNYNSKPRRWMTQCLHMYFGSPWTIIAWVGAALALFFTAVQTYFSAFSH